MSYKRNVLVIILIYANVEILAFQPDYYWRDYFGKIPDDAVLAGEDTKGPIYIGQAYIHQPAGLVVAPIRPGVSSVDAPYYGPKTISKFIKILCGKRSHFRWLTVNGTDLHLVLNDRQPVHGGAESNLGLYYIGRITIEGELKIGKIDSWQTAPLMYYLHNNKEISIKSYQILVNVGSDLNINSAK